MVDAREANKQIEGYPEYEQYEEIAINKEMGDNWKI